MDEDEEEIIEFVDDGPGSGPASGGYGGGAVFGDLDDDDGSDAEAERVEALQVKRGLDDRAFFDNAAKDDDERKRRARSELDARKVALGTLRQKQKKKEHELSEMEKKIDTEKAGVERLKAKMYRTGASELAASGISGAGGAAEISGTSNEDDDSELTLDRAYERVEKLESEKSAMLRELAQIKEHLHKEDGAIAQIERSLLRS